MRGISWIAEELLASQEELSYMESKVNRMIIPCTQSPSGELVGRVPALCETRRFITVFTRACYCSLPRSTRINFTACHSISLSYILMLPPCFPYSLSGFPARTLHAFLVSPTHSTYHLNNIRWTVQPVQSPVTGPLLRICMPFTSCSPIRSTRDSVWHVSSPFTGAFAKLRKATVSFMSVRMHETAPLPLDGFWWNIWIFEPFSKSTEKIQVSLKSDKSNGYFTWRRFHIYDNISLNSS